MSKTVTGIINEKAEEMFEDSLIEEGTKSYVKAGASGFIEGLVDGCFIVGAYYFVKGLIGLVRGDF